MKDEDFLDFTKEGGYEVLFPDDKDASIECTYCGRKIHGNEEVVWIDKEQGIVQCPECGKELEIEE